MKAFVFASMLSWDGGFAALPSCPDRDMRYHLSCADGLALAGKDGG